LAPVTTMFATGGFGAFRRPMALELGGFDPLFWPGYSEETDLCYRAWQRGWEVRYEPASVVWHRESASMSVSTNGRVASLMRQKHLLFYWKHFSNEKSTYPFLWSQW
jgi:GT2 family glycosyltransferase